MTEQKTNATHPSMIKKAEIENLKVMVTSSRGNPYDTVLLCSNVSVE